MQSETAKCIRNGKMNSELSSRELVPGDIIELHTGDHVPADCRVVKLIDLTAARVDDPMAVMKHFNTNQDGNLVGSRVQMV